MESLRQKPEEVIAEIKSRWSIADLREQSEADLAHGDTLFHKAATPLVIVSQGTHHGVIRWWIIESSGNEYEVRRFKNFVWCSCKSFFFSKRMCKHLAFTTGVYCERCRILAAKVGKLCYDCDGIVNHFSKRPTTQQSAHETH